MKGYVRVRIYGVLSIELCIEKSERSESWQAVVLKVSGDTEKWISN